MKQNSMSNQNWLRDGYMAWFCSLLIKLSCCEMDLTWTPLKHETLDFLGISRKVIEVVLLAGRCTSLLLNLLKAALVAVLLKVCSCSFFLGVPFCARVVVLLSLLSCVHAVPLSLRAKSLSTEQRSLALLK